MERTWETCISFHGHPCPVLATGYRASVEALRILHITDLHREKLACIAENQVCGANHAELYARKRKYYHSESWKTGLYCHSPFGWKSCPSEPTQ